MRKLSIFFTLFCLSSTLSFGQSIGLRAGYNLSTVKWKSAWDSNIDELNDLITSKSGFQIGVNFDIPVSKTFSIEPGINFSSNGYTINRTNVHNGIATETTSKSTLYYLDMPVYFKAGLNVGTKRLFVAAGPYLGVALDIGNSISIEDYNRFDFGASFGAGVEMGAFEVGVYYDLGLKNNHQVTIIKSYNRSLSFSLGYRFGK